MNVAKPLWLRYKPKLSHRFCARVREKLTASEDVSSGVLLTTEQVRRAMNVYLESANLPPRCRTQMQHEEVKRQEYYQRRNAVAATSHRKRRRKELEALGIDPDSIKSLEDKPQS